MRMVGDYPFHAQRVHFDIVLPSIIVDHLEVDADKCEVIRQYSVDEYYKKNPRTIEELSLQQLLDSGVSIREVPTNIYESNDEGELPSQSELSNIAESIVDSQTLENEEN